MEAFEQLEIWKRSCRLCAELYKSLESCRAYGYRDQVTRSALSVPSNIAEGYERNSSREFVRFLKIAKGSCGELRTQLYIGIEAGFLEKTYAMGFISEATELARMIQGLIKKIDLRAPAEN